MSKATEKHKKKCKCIFCNSHCPECGSPRISVEFITSYKINNIKFDNIIDILEVNQGVSDDVVKLKCSDCDGSFDSIMDKRLHSLRSALIKDIIPIDSSIHVNTKHFTSHCPEYNIKRVPVTFNASFRYKNNIKNCINIYRDTDYDKIEIYCPNCGKSFDGTADERLQKFSANLGYIMFRNIDINIYDDREITIGIDEFIEDDGDEDDWDDDDPREYF